MRTIANSTLLFLALTTLAGCAGRRPLPTVDDLELDTVVLYRNGIGYFERHGKVDEDVLRIKVRKDQVNDLLKSLTVVDEDGQAVSVSMPLDPSSWANAAMAVLAAGVLAVTVGVGLVESLLARFAFRKVPLLLTTAFLLCLFALLVAWKGGVP